VRGGSHSRDRHHLDAPLQRGEVLGGELVLEGDGFGFAVVVGGGLLAHHVADDALLDGPRLGEGAEEGGPRHRLSLGQPLEFILLRFRFPQTHFR
jgi:hypothetical protein